MNNSIKQFKCDKCNKYFNIVIWKSIYNNNLYLCDKCWKKFDLKINIEIYEKIINLNINN